jgi:hypothetical protein
MWDATYSAGEWSVMGNNQAMRIKTNDLVLFQRHESTIGLFTARIFITNMTCGRDSALSPTFFPTLTSSNNLIPIFTHSQLTLSLRNSKEFRPVPADNLLGAWTLQSSLAVAFDGVVQSSRPECVTACPTTSADCPLQWHSIADKIFVGNSYLNATVILYIGDDTVP